MFLAHKLMMVNSSTFLPEDMFANSEVGAWYDPSDLSTLFQDSAGTIPVTSDGDPVGKMLDKSGNGYHQTQSNNSYRPVYKTDGTRHWLQFTAASAQYMTGDIALTGANSSDNCIAFAYRIESGASSPSLFISSCFYYWFYSTGGTSRASVQTTYTNTVSGVTDMNGTDTITRLEFDAATSFTEYKDGVEIGQDASISGNKNISGGVFDLGKAGSGRAPFNGRFYGLLIANRLSTSDEAKGLDHYFSLLAGI